MPRNIEKWLEDLGLGKYVGVFGHNDIDFRVLPELTEDDLKHLGVSLGHRRILQKAIASLSQNTQQSGDSQPRPSPVSESDPGLAAWERQPGERKPVTMLFADITGSTVLTKNLDAEDTHDLLYGATQRMCEAIENNRGTVCRFMGDGVMAMFGAPIGSEQHALEACRAALDMQTRLNDYSTDLQASHGTGLQARVGLHSGEVVVLKVGDDPDHPEYDASGPTVPLAARMEQAAEPGTVLMTDATRTLAGNLVESEVHIPVTVKGFAEPVAVYVLRRIRSGGERGTETHRPFVGRRGELAQFRGVLEACLEARHGQSVCVRGDAGIGKTRLVGQFMRLAEALGFDCHKGLVIDFGVGKGQDPIRALVGSLLGIDAAGGEAECRAALFHAEEQNLVDVGQRVFFNDLLDLPQPTELRTLYDAMSNDVRKEGKLESIRNLLGQLSSRRAVLLLVEDVHWADSVALEHLASLAAGMGELAALLVMTSRVEGDPIDFTWRSRAGNSPILTTDLGPLHESESVAMVGTLIDSMGDMAKQCIERAAGNPLFLEQLLRSLQEGTSEGVPDSIQSLVLTRLDHFPAPDKRALRVASVLGQRFGPDVLRHLLGDDSYDCRTLIEHHLIRPEDSVYLFSHALIREGVYASLLKEQRREFHRRAAEWFAEREPVLYAEHLERAADPRAPAAYEQAARLQARGHRFERALTLVEHGLSLCRSDPERFRLCMLRGELMCDLGQTEKAIAAFNRAVEIDLGPSERCRARIGVAEGLRLNEQHEELLQELEAAEPLAREHALVEELARIEQLRSSVHFIRGDIEACLNAGAAALGFARASDSPRVEAQALSTLGDAEYARGRMVSAFRQYDHCVKLSREHGLVRIEAANLLQRGDCHFYHHRLEAAREDTELAMHLAAQIRNPRSEMLGLISLVYVFDIRGDIAAATPLAERSLRLARELGAGSFAAWNLVWLARTYRLGGDQAKALEYLDDAIQICHERAMRFCGPIALGTLALTTSDP